MGLVERDLPVVLPAGYFSLQQFAQLPDDVRFINGPFLYRDHDVASLVADGFHEVHVDRGFDDKIGVALPRGQAVGADQVDMGAGFDPLTRQYGLRGGRGGAYQVAGAGFCRVCRRSHLDAGALCLLLRKSPYLIRVASPYDDLIHGAHRAHGVNMGHRLHAVTEDAAGARILARQEPRRQT